MNLLYVGFLCVYMSLPYNFVDSNKKKDVTEIIIDTDVLSMMNDLLVENLRCYVKTKTKKMG